VVVEFADGGDVVLEERDRQRTNGIISQEVSRRRKQRLSLDCCLRRQKGHDRLVVYVHPSPTHGGRKKKLQMGEWTDGAGI
jgi:hypothetical protein